MVYYILDIVVSYERYFRKEKKEVIKNLYLSGIGEEFIAMQLDLEIPIVIGVLTELGEYKSLEQYSYSS
jgi:hypothetical protein